MELTKKDLKYTYSWTAIRGDNPKVTGEPDSTLFNRNEGYEVLYLINKIAEIKKWKTKNTLLNLEEKIKNKLPSNIRSQKNVKEWLDKN